MAAAEPAIFPGIYSLLAGSPPGCPAGRSSKRLKPTSFILARQAVHDRPGPVRGNQPVLNGDAADVGEVVVVEPSVGAPPAGQNAGGRIEEGLEIGGSSIFAPPAPARGVAAAADRIGGRSHLAQGR